MSVAESVQAEEERGSSPGAPSRRRGWTSRVSVGQGLMVAAGLLAALLNFVALRGAEDVTHIVTAARDIQPGEILSADLLTTVPLTGSTSGLVGIVHADRIGELEGATTAARIAEGEPVLRSALSPSGSTDGSRAMSVPLDPAHAVGGRLRVGDRVDVIEVDDAGARYVATDVEVIGVTDVASGGALGGGLTSYSVTLSVDDVTALRLAAGIRSDRLQVVRSTGAPPPSTREHRVDDSRPGAASEDGEATAAEGT